MLGQSPFWNALRNTFSIFLLSSVPQVLMAITIAALLDAKLRAKTFWRMGVLLPYVVAPGRGVAGVRPTCSPTQSGLVKPLLIHRPGSDPWQTDASGPVTWRSPRW